MGAWKVGKGDAHEDVDAGEHHNRAQVGLENEPHGHGAVQHVLHELHRDEDDEHDHRRLSHRVT